MHSSLQAARLLPPGQDASRQRCGKGPTVAIGGKKRSGTESQGNGAETPPTEWKHDSAKYGSPRQDWSMGSKAIWILYVVQQELGVTQLSASAITDTFNRKFKQAGTIRGSNVSRDLGNLKVKNPGLVGDDTTKAAVEWFLTDAGIIKVQEMIAGIFTPTSAA